MITSDVGIANKAYRTVEEGLQTQYSDLRVTFCVTRNIGLYRNCLVNQRLISGHVLSSIVGQREGEGSSVQTN
jgi:hypothetical protein